MEKRRPAIRCEAKTPHPCRPTTLPIRRRSHCPALPPNLLRLTARTGFAIPIIGLPFILGRLFRRESVISPQPFGGGRVAIFRFLPQQVDLLRPEMVDTAGGHGGIGIVAFFVQYLLQSGREDDAPPFQFICPRGGILITVGGQVSFGIGQQFFIGRHGIGSRWRMFFGGGRLSGMAGLSRQEVRSNKAAKMAGRRFMFFTPIKGLKRRQAEGSR